LKLGAGDTKGAVDSAVDGALGYGIGWAAKGVGAGFGKLLGRSGRATGAMQAFEAEVIRTGGRLPESLASKQARFQELLRQAEKQLERIKGKYPHFPNATNALSKKALKQRLAWLENELLRLRRIKAGQALPMKSMSPEELQNAISRTLDELKWVAGKLKK
jgi:hypothetical protein